MSYVKKDKWLELLSEVENLTADKEELRKGYIDLVIKKKRATRKSRIKSIIIILLALFSIVVIYNKQNEVVSQNLVVDQNIHQHEAIEDEIQDGEDENQLLETPITKKEKPIQIQEKKDVIVFTVQIGALRKLAIKNELNKSSNFKTFKNKDGLNIYSLGEFDNYEAARVFRKQVKKLGFKDAFIIKLKNNKKIPI